MFQSNQASNSCESSEEGDTIDDDWLLKLANSKENARESPEGTSDLGLSNAKIPLLCEDKLDFKERTKRTIRVGLRKIWKRGSATITEEDPTYKVSYLGNVLTGWAKGEGCIEKPLNTLWKNYNESLKPSVQMKITVTQSGLKATTKDHGLIEYWSHRITFCTVPSHLPQIFCWIYRHEGRKLKQELRCHAVLCSKESIAAQMAVTLKTRLTQALVEFKRDKLLRQNARLSLVNSVYENPSLPRRKILLSTGCHNYKPPLERSKSAPKLMSIEESLEEDESAPKSNQKLIESNNKEHKINGWEDKKCLNKVYGDEKCEYKLTNLPFVKKLCSSIENLVESTSNYSKKFFTERKTGKDLYISMKNLEESIRKKSVDETRGENAISNRSKVNKMVAFETNNGIPVKCTDFKKLSDDDNGGGGNDDEVQLQKNILEIRVEGNNEKSVESSDFRETITQESGNAKYFNDGHLPPSFDKPLDKVMMINSTNYLNVRGNSMEKLRTYLTNSNNDKNHNEVVLHPEGSDTDQCTAVVDENSHELIDDKCGGDVLNDNEEEEEGDVGDDNDDYAGAKFNDNQYHQFTENLVQRLSLDVPYHKIIKSNALSERRMQSSCLQI